MQQRRREPSVIVAAKAGTKMDMMMWPDAVWEDDKDVRVCSNRRCGVEFSLTVHKHHCRYCGLIFCNSCAPELVVANGTPLLKTKRTKVRRCNSCRLPIIMRAYRQTLDGPLTAEPIETILSYLDNASVNALLQSCAAMQSQFHVRKVPYFEQLYNRFPSAYTGATMGKGASGTVLFVEDRTRGDMKVALKLVPKTSVFSYQVWRRLYDEIDIMRGNSHVNVCQMHEVLQTKSDLVIVMECGEGGTLKAAYEVIRKHRYDMEVFAAHVATQVAAGLEYLYGRNIVHRDLKIENVILSADFSRVMLIDFGLAAIIRDRAVPQRFTACGTPGYAAPVNLYPVVVKRSTFFDATGDELHSADLFSLGVILFMLLSNTKPMQGKRFGDMYKEMQAGLKCQGPKWTAISDGGKQVVEGLLAFKTSQRWTAQDVISNTWVKDKAPQFQRIADELLREWESQSRRIAEEFDMIDAHDDDFHLVEEDEYAETFDRTQEKLKE